MSRRKLAVITARADDREQKDIICGISEAAFATDTDVVVFSNIENHWFTHDVLNFENIVYSYFDPAEFCGAVITGEAFMEFSVISEVIEKIRSSKLPTVVIGKEIEGLESIFYDDYKDLEKICNHLIDVHGITDIDFMTGPKDDRISQSRIDGCRKSFEKHGLYFDESRVFYGTFWYSFGEEIAAKYISGELKLPKAVVCASDSMAFSLCDRLIEAGIRIPEELTVTGYDSTGARVHYHPILTTYKNDRHGIGIKVANKLLSTDYQYKSEDRFLPGNTCKCGIDQLPYYYEMWDERWEHPSVLVINKSECSSPFLSQNISLCKNLWEYLSVINDYFYIPEANEMLLCLDSEWSSSKHIGEEYICCKVDGTDKRYEPYTVSRSDMLLTATSFRSEPSVYYIYPIVFQTRLYGLAALAYDNPVRFKHKMRSWSEIVSNGLEFLRLKNDIHYLTLCQKTSSLFDSLTGFYKMPEFRRSISDRANESSQIIAVKIGFMSSKEYAYDGARYSDIISSVALSIKQVCDNEEILCRTDNDVFLIYCSEQADSILEKLEVILHRNVYVKYIDSPPIISVSKIDNATSKGIKATVNSVEEINSATVAELQAGQTLPQYVNISELRKEIAANPQSAPDIAEASKRLCVSEGYFSTIYKKYYGISYVQDCINEKIILAKYLLCSTVMSVYSVAVKCGYADEKYFARQFHRSTGYSPSQYRKKHCSSSGNI